MKEEPGKILLAGKNLTNDNSVSELFFKSGYSCDVLPFDVELLKNIDFTEYKAIVIDDNAVSENPVKYINSVFGKSLTPLIILSSEDDVLNHVFALEIGADDYIVKPVDSRVLVAKVKAIIRCSQRKHIAEENIITCEGLIINRAKHTVEVDGEIVSMPSKEFELLSLLAAHPNRVFTREELLENVWGFDFSGKTRTIDVHIKRLRNKVEKDRLPWGIATVWSVGYKFEVRE